jgi:hypothetical protein
MTLSMARIENFFLGHVGKSGNGAFRAKTFDVIISGAMAALTTGVLGSFFFRSDALEMRVSREFVPHVLVALFASFTTDVFVGGAGEVVRRRWFGLSHKALNHGTQSDQQSERQQRGS